MLRFVDPRAHYMFLILYIYFFVSFSLSLEKLYKGPVKIFTKADQKVDEVL